MVNTKTTAPSTTIDEKNRRSRRLKIVLGVFGVLAAFLAIVVAAELIPGQSPTSVTNQAAGGKESGGSTEMDFVRRDADDPMAIGDVDAPVVLTEWLDMRCPFCAVISRDTLPTLIEEYVETGKVRIEFHDLVFYGEQSEAAAVAARAAGRQGKYVEYVTAVYAVAPERSHPELPREALIEFAEKSGVPDMEQFVADLDDPGLLADVQASQQAAEQLGVTSAPFFVAGDTALSGAQPLEGFRDFLDDALAKAE